MSDIETELPGPLIGRWEKLPAMPCAEKYPYIITFSKGTYRGARGPGQGMVWWDAGIYRLEGPRTLMLTVATDELLAYSIDLHADRFDVIDSDGCRFSYRRTPPAT
jgi:hypothetical protein